MNDDNLTQFNERENKQTIIDKGHFYSIKAKKINAINERKTGINIEMSFCISNLLHSTPTIKSLNDLDHALKINRMRTNRLNELVCEYNQRYEDQQQTIDFQSLFIELLKFFCDYESLSDKDQQELISRILK